MSLFSTLAEWLRPCVHTWRIISQMQDDPSRPTTVKVIRECEICGALDERMFTGPPLRCPPHKWETVQRNSVWAEDDDKFPAYHRLEQRCTVCGEVRAVDLKPEEQEGKNGVARGSSRGHGSKKGQPTRAGQGVANAP